MTEKAKPRVWRSRPLEWMLCFSLFLSVILEMLSKPKIFRDSKSEVIKGQAIEVSCQSSDGTSPIFYQLFKANNVLKSHNMSSNEPAVFKDNPTKDVEYYCIVDNCHSHTKMVSEVLRVKVIGKLPCYEKKSRGIGALVHIFKGLGVSRDCVDEKSGWYLYKVHKHDMW